MRQLLSDVVVVDLSREPAGTYCGKVFADLGADVVKVEPPEGDPLRANPAAFVHLNTNKRSVVVDGSPAGAELLAKLLDGADVVIETKDSGDFAAFGTSVDEVRASCPGLVVTTISGFGATGPYASYRWTDLVNQAVSGALLPSRTPVKLPGMVGLCTVGHVAATGALAGVLRSRASGVGAHVDCAAYEALGSVPSRVSRFLGWEYLAHGASALAAPPPGATLIPIGLFPCADGYVSMMSTPQQLNEMLDVLDDDALREAFARPDAFVRPETREALDLALYPWLVAHTRAELTEAAQAAGWPVAGVNSPREVLDADHLHQRAYWVRVEDPTVGPVQLAGPPYRHTEGGWRLRRRAPLLGEHGTEVRAQSTAPRVPDGWASKPRRAACAGHSRRRPDDGVVGALPDPACLPTSVPRSSGSRTRRSSRPRRRATSRDPVATRRPAACSRCTRRDARVSRTARTTGTR